MLSFTQELASPQIQKGKRAENVTPQIRSFTDRIFSMGMLSSSLLILLAAVQCVSLPNRKIHRQVGSQEILDVCAL